MRENFINFGTSALVAAITSINATTFTVTTSQGQLFPSANFLCTIDTEVMLIASVSGDTFTVVSGGRGYDGTVAATHNTGATVQLSICRYNFVHIWQNLADTLIPEVPPVQLGIIPSSYDNEFESLGNWTLFPSPGLGTTFSVNSAVKSHLVLSRGSGDNGLYTAYTGFGLSSAYTITCKLSHGLSLVQDSGTIQAQFSLFVSDQINPSASADAGNRFRVDTVISSQGAHGVLNYNDFGVKAAQNVSGVFHAVGLNQVPLSPGQSLWLRITYDGASNFTAYFGDGLTYWTLGTISMGFSAQSLGVNFHVFPLGGLWMPQVAAVDYVRVFAGQALSPFGGLGY